MFTVFSFFKVEIKDDALAFVFTHSVVQKFVIACHENFFQYSQMA